VDVMVSANAENVALSLNGRNFFIPVIASSEGLSVVVFD